MDRREFVAALAAAPFALRTPVALGGGTPVALVTADEQAHVAAVELSSGRVLRRIPTLPGPRSVESLSGALAVIAHTEHGAVSILRGRDLRVVRVLSGLGEPRYTAAHPDGRHAFVTDSARAEVVVVDAVRGRVVHRVAVGGPARHLSLDGRGRTLWVALGTRAELVAVLDVSRPAAPRVERRFRPPFLAHDVGFASAGGPVWVTSGDRGSIALYDRRRGRVVHRLDGDAPPQHVTFEGGRAYVTSGDDGLLRVHDAEDGTLLRTTRIPAGSYNVQRGWGRILTPSLARGTLCVVSASGRIVTEARVASSSHDACFVMSA